MLGIEIVTQLELKGYCVVDPALDPTLFRKARANIGECDSRGLLKLLPEVLLDGLLGGEGSARCVDFSSARLDQSPSDFEALLQLDKSLLDMAGTLSSVLLSLGISAPSRTPAMLHETGLALGEPPELSEEEASNWLVTFARGKVLMLLCLGPVKGTLSLEPFDESEGVEIPTFPGSLIIVRADLMFHRHFANSKAYILSCFLLESARAAKRTLVSPEQMSPPVRQVEEWTVSRLRQLKELEQESKAMPPNVPSSWISAMNHMFHTVQRVAVRGSAARYSSSWVVEEWYQSQATGVDLVMEVPFCRWDVNQYYHSDPECWRAQRCFMRHSSFVDGLELFDNRFFGLSNMEAAGMDPHQRVVLEVGYEALHKAGYKKAKLMNSLGGVYLGSSMTIFGCVASVCGATGGAASINSNRFSFCLGLKGPSMTCDTEGSSSLTAVHLGAEAVLDKGRGVVNQYSLSGGVHFELGPIFWPQMQGAGLLSRCGRCLTWDAAADGYTLGDGCGFVVLKKLTETVDGAQVYIQDEPLVGAVCGSIMNSSGGGAAMHSPNGAAEQQLIAEALRSAGLQPLNIDAVECNGQGSFLADGVEVDSLLRILRREDVTEPLSLTAVKTRVGHLMECAGIASLQRLLLAGAWGSMTPNNHLRQLNPYLDTGCNVNYLTECLEQPMQSSYAGVTSRGFGGTNVHVITFSQIDGSRTAPPENSRLDWWHRKSVPLKGAPGDPAALAALARAKAYFTGANGDR